jgi:hypothetical protein
MLYLASSPESVDYRIRAKCPLLGTKVYKSPANPVVKEIATNNEVQRKPADFVACVQSFNCLTPNSELYRRSSCRFTFQHLTRKLSNTEVSHCRGALHLEQKPLGLINQLVYKNTLAWTTRNSVHGTLSISILTAKM